MPHRVAMVLSVLIIAGCAGGERSRGLGLDGWIGATDRELVLSWGAPDGVYPLADGSRVLTWRSTYSEAADGYVPARPGVEDGPPGAPRRYVCITNIEVSALGIIRDYTIQGDGCPLQPE